jgi:hypothetical protein
MTTTTKHCEYCNDDFVLNNVHWYKSHRKPFCKIEKYEKIKHIKDKVCKKCNITKDVGCFFQNLTKLDGRNNVCKICDPLYVKKQKDLTIPDTKQCKKCKHFKALDEYSQKIGGKYNKNTICKECKKVTSQDYRNKNPEKNKEYYRSWDSKKKKEFTEKRRVWAKLKRQTDKFYKYKQKIRTTMNRAFTRKLVKKSKKTELLLGCSMDFFLKYLEGLFKPGMTFDNHGTHGWHIDHIVPLKVAKTIEEIEKLCHYTNLQPLWAEENLKKSGNIL